MRRDLLMVLRLIGNIFQCLVNNRLAHGKRRISTLPSKTPVFWPKPLQPSATIALHLLHQMRDTLVAREEEKDVHVVARSTRTNYLATRFVDELADVTMQTLQMCIRHFGADRLHMEDDVQVDFT